MKREDQTLLCGFHHAEIRAEIDRHGDLAFCYWQEDGELGWNHHLFVIPAETLPAIKKLLDGLSL